MEYATIAFCERELNTIYKNTMVDFNNNMREVCAASLLKAPCVVGGENMEVENSWELFFSLAFNAGRCLPTQWVFGGFL